MKQLITLLALSLGLAAGAQTTELRAGALTTYQWDAREVSFGGEFQAGLKWGRASGAIGGQVIDLKGAGIYAPFFLSAGYEWKGFTFHVDPGFGIHTKTISIFDKDYQQIGGLYVGAGVRRNFGPLYVGAQYSQYGFALTNFSGSASHVSAATLTVGYSLHPKD